MQGKHNHKSQHSNNKRRRDDLHSDDESSEDEDARAKTNTKPPTKQRRIHSKSRPMVAKTGVHPPQREDATEEEQAMLRELKLQVFKLQEALKRMRGNKGHRKAKKQVLSEELTAMQRQAKKVAKTKLWQVCKIITCEEFLDKATNFVLEVLQENDQLELEGLPDELQIQKQEQWKVDQRSWVLHGCNEQRNQANTNVHGTVKKHHKDKKMHLLPTKEEMQDLVLRRGFFNEERVAANGGTEDQLAEARAKDERMRDLGVLFCDVLLPKIAGVAVWSPWKRSHINMSAYDPPIDENGNPRNGVPCDPSNEAYLCLCWENALDKWIYILDGERDEGEDLRPTPTTKPWSLLTPLPSLDSSLLVVCLRLAWPATQSWWIKSLRIGGTMPPMSRG